MTVRIQVENAYEDGEQVTRETDVPYPDDPVDYGSWWEDVVFPETGIGRDGNACYTVTVLDADEMPELVGMTREWC